MLENNALTARASRRSLRGAKATCDVIAGLCHGDPAEGLVVKYIARLVADGFAEWYRLDDGDIQLRFNTGETFLLIETVIVRLS